MQLLQQKSKYYFSIESNLVACNVYFFYTITITYTLLYVYYFSEISYLQFELLLQKTPLKLKETLGVFCYLHFFQDFFT